MPALPGLRLQGPIGPTHGGGSQHGLVDGRGHAGAAGPDPAGRPGPNGLILFRPQCGGRRRLLFLALDGWAGPISACYGVFFFWLCLQLLHLLPCSSFYRDI